MRFPSLPKRDNLASLEAIVIIVLIVGAAITLALGGMVKSNSIRIVDASSSLLPGSPYGEANLNVTTGYNDDFNGWKPGPGVALTSQKDYLVISGTFQNASSWQNVNLFKIAAINIRLFPILMLNVNVTEGVRYGIRFFANYPNGTEYNVWWEGSPLDHRSAMGQESLRVNMQREAFLATGNSVDVISRLQLYVEDRPYSPQAFRLVLSRLSFERDRLEDVSHSLYRAIYFDLNSFPQGNVSWSLNKVSLEVTVQASEGTTISIYLFDGPTIYASTTATALVYSSLTPSAQYTFYPNLLPSVFTEQLPLSDQSVVFVASGGTL